MTQKNPIIQLYIPFELRKWVDKSADENHRTVDDEIIHLLNFARAHIENVNMPIEFDGIDPNASFNELKRYTQRLAEEVHELLLHCERRKQN